MGAKHSSIAELSDNHTLKWLCGDVKIKREDEFWDDLLAFTFSTPLTKPDNRLLRENIASLCEKLAFNNKTTGNFTTLVCVFICYAKELLTDETKVEDLSTCRKCLNSLLLSRCYIEYIVENLEEEFVLQQFNTLPSFEGTRTVLEEFLLTVSSIISTVSVQESTYHIHLEAVNSILVLLSVQMYEARPCSESALYLSLMNGKCAENAVQFVRKLLHSYIKNDKSPPMQPSPGMLGWATSSLWSLIGGKAPTPLPDDALHPLANHSVLLLLVLSFHFTKDVNPYRNALFQCRAGKKSEDEQSPEKEQSFPLNFKRLYYAISRDLEMDQTVLLLYLLLHKNQSFLRYLLQRQDLDTVVVPILQVLYNAAHLDSHHIYMALIVILILTQEDAFNNCIHDLPVSDVSWYKDKNLTGISLGSLLVLIVLRTIQFNMAKLRDKYLHTNCLASLANMSSNFKYLHSYAAQKLMTLFQQLTKKHSRYSERIKEGQVSGQDELTDLAVLEEIIRMMLEILNSCLCTTLHENSNIIFTLLRSKELFQDFRSNPKFQDIIQNIDTVLNYFGAQVEKKAGASTSAEEIITVINESIQTWPKDTLQKFPDLKFKYMEEDAAEEFFVPYIWSIVYKSSYLHWNSEKVTLFHVSPT